MLRILRQRRQPLEDGRILRVSHAEAQRLLHAAENAAVIYERIAAADQPAHEAGVGSAAALSGGGGTS